MRPAEHLRQYARDEWTVTVDVATPMPVPEPGLDDGSAVRYVEAEADGTRYVVTVSRLPAGHREGGPLLVTVLWPWTAAHVMAAGGLVTETYVREHLAPRDREVGLVDVTALTLTVGHALARPVETVETLLSRREAVEDRRENRRGDFL